MLRPPPSSTLFPYTTLFRSARRELDAGRSVAIATDLQTGKRSLVPANTCTAENVYVEVLHPSRDRKSTRLNSSHPSISYAVFCLKKKKQKTLTPCLY